MRRRRHDVGTPEQLGDIAKDAVLVWSTSEPDYMTHLSAIQVNAGAGRLDRPHDVIPLDVRRLAMSFEERDDLAEAVRVGRVTIAWRVAECVPELPDDLREWALRKRFSMGQASLRVLPLAVAELARWMPVEDIGESWWSRRRNEHEVRGIFLSFERSHYSHDELDALGCRAIVVVPHWTRRGPNGVMVLTRGQEHPLTARFAKASAWVLGDGFVRDCTHARIVRVLEVFTSHEVVEGVRIEWGEDDLVPRRLDGPALLDALAQVDLVEVDTNISVPITIAGALHLDLDRRLPVDVAGQVLHALSGRAAARP